MNILILTGKFGMGHYSAAVALSERLGCRLEDANIYVEDLFSRSLRRRCALLYGYFSFVVRRGNWIYNWVYRRTENKEKKGRFPLEGLFLKTLGQLIEKTGADVVISTLPICSQLVSEYKQAGGKPVTLVTCITDVTSHREWLYPRTDLYLVPAPKIKESLVVRGVTAARVIVGGIPVRGRFEAEGRRRDEGQKRVLIMGGGFGLLPKSADFYEQLGRLTQVRFTVITGKNRRLYKKLRGRYPNVDVLPYVADVCSYMKQSDLIVSKPGGVTLYEAIAAELPLLMFSPFLEQEIRNGDFVLENSLGLVLPKKPEALADEIGKVICDDDLLASIRRNMRRFKASLDPDGLPEALTRCGKLAATA